MRFTTALALGSVLLALVAGCTDDPAPEPRAPEVAALKATWESTALSGASTAWRYDDLVVVTNDDRIAGIDAGTGETRWTLDLPATACSWAQTPSQSGILAVVLTAKPSGCLAAGAIDLTSGKLLWHHALDHPHGKDLGDFRGISASDRTVVATDKFGVVRLGARTGKVRSTEDDAFDYVSDGRYLASLRWPRHRESTVVRIEDIDTGKRIASYPAGDTYSLTSLSGDPLVVGSERGRWGTNLFVGATGTAMGRGQGYFTAATDGLLVTAHQDIVVANDLRSGDEVFTAPVAESAEVVGLDGEAAIVTSRAAVYDDATGVERVDLSGSGKHVVLGKVRGPGLLVADGALVTRSSDGIRSYQLPSTGPAASELEDALAWEPGDLRAADAFDACTAVSGSTLTRLGLDPAERVNGSCWWGGGARMSVTINAHRPTARGSAVANAKEELDLAARGVGAGDIEELPDLGDRAWLAVSDPESVSVEARHRNVVVTVSVQVPRPLSGDPARVTDAAVQAATEVIAELEKRAAK